MMIVLYHILLTAIYYIISTLSILSILCHKMAILSSHDVIILSFCLSSHIFLIVLMTSTTIMMCLLACFHPWTSKIQSSLSSIYLKLALLSFLSILTFLTIVFYELNIFYQYECDLVEIFEHHMLITFYMHYDLSNDFSQPI